MNPLDYSLCCQSVTVYRKAGDTVTRQVKDGCYYSWQDRLTRDDLGRRTDRSFLLILPETTQSVFPGDRIYPGIGPEVVDWDTFIPETVPGLSEAEYARLCMWEGKPCHTEAAHK